MLPGKLGYIFDENIRTARINEMAIFYWKT
jgi:hypothetical protein